MKFLIVKTSSLGDIIHAFPVVDYLKKVYPTSRIDWVAEAPFAELVEAHPQLHTIHSVESKKWRKARDWKGFRVFKKQLQSISYDAVFDLQGNCKSALITWLAKSAHKIGFGKNTVAEWPNLLVTNFKIDPPLGMNIREDYLSLAESFIGEKKSPSYTLSLKLNPSFQNRLNELIETLPECRKVMVCPGSAWPNKQMDTSSLGDVLKKIPGAYFLILSGNEKEKCVAQELAKTVSHSLVLDRQPLPVLQNLMTHMDLIIAMDSLPLHLASTTSTPTFSIFGASSSDKYKPPGAQHLSLQGPCPYGKMFDKRCPALRTCKTGACIKSFDRKELFESMKKIAALGHIPVF